MKFEIEFIGTFESRAVNYIEVEYSINTDPSTSGSDFDLVWNKLNLAVIDGEIKQVWGYIGDIKANTLNFGEPISDKGILRIISDFDEGLAYRISYDEQPVFFDEDSGWILIGKQPSSRIGVEFINGCVAFIDECGCFEALWIKPIFI